MHSDVDDEPLDPMPGDEAGLSDFDQDDIGSLQFGVDVADPLCVKLNDLIKRGKIGKSKILYKYLNDVIEVFYDPFHEYDREVIEFFNSLTYLGGRSVTCFLRGPMHSGDGKYSHIDGNNTKRINLGGPSESTCLRHQAGYTNEPGAWKPLSLIQMELLKKSECTPIVKTQLCEIYPCVLANDGTALKPAIEFDSRLKENVGLTFNIELSYVKRNQCTFCTILERTHGYRGFGFISNEP